MADLKGQHKKNMKDSPASGDYNPDNYLGYFGLSRDPFPVAPDNTDFYISQQIDTIIKKLTQAVFSRKGFMLLTGEIGLGKTTISRRIIDILETHHVETSIVLQSFHQEAGLLKEIVMDFGINVEEVRNDMSTLMKLLNDFLLSKNKEGINCVILIDDAQNLTTESLELIRMISNLEADREKLVQILLVGQLELLYKLNSQELRQLKSRVTVNQTHAPLQKAETGPYLQFKLHRAGDRGKITIDEKAVKKLYSLTCGNLRNINIIMDHALHQACINQTHTLSAGYIKKAHQELVLENPGFKKPPAAAWIILTLVFIIVGISAGFGLFYYQTAGFATALAQKEKMPDQQILAPAQEKKKPQPLDDSRVGTTGPAVKSQTGTPPLAIPGSVRNFLAAYGLESFAPDFQAALTQKHFTRLEKQIFDTTGYQMIVLRRLTPGVREKYDMLSYIDPATHKKEYYLFWKPVLKIIKFYSGYRGEEISDLQTLLARAGRYDYKIDGIVGQIIMKSVKEFQRDQDFLVTGFPDPVTVFMLVNGPP